MNSDVLFARPLAQRNEIWDAAPASRFPVAAEAGAGVIDLSLAYSTEPTPEHIGEAARAALDRGETHYVDRLGIKPLRQAIAETMARDGIAGVTVDDLLVTSGAQEALFVLLNSLMNPGDEMLVPDPGYPLVEPLAQLAGGKVVRTSVVDHWDLTVSDLNPMLTARSRLLYLPLPNPATGRAIAPAELDLLVQWAEQNHLVVILDAALQRGLGAEDLRPRFPGGIPDHVLVIDSLSKFYRMSGWRIGWIAGSPALLKPVRDLKQALSICSASISQWAAVAALTGPQEWLAEQQAELQGRQELVLAALTASGLEFVVPHVPCGVWVDIRKTKKTSAGFVAFALEKAQVRLDAGTAYGAAGEGFVRISLFPPRAQLQTGLERLQRVLGPVRT